MTLKHLCACAVAVLVFGGGIAPQLGAEEPIGARAAAEDVNIVFEDLGTTQTGVDVWKMACPSGTAKVSADVGDQGVVDGRRLTVTLVRASTGKTSLKTAGDGAISAPATLSGGSGTYYVVISKTIGYSTKVGYDSAQRCLNSAGADLPFSPVLAQDF
jgi:hypothetical protein